VDLAIFRQAVETAPFGVIIADATDATYPVLYVNPAFARMTGYRADEMLGKSCRFLMGEDRAAPERAKLRKALADSLPCTVVLKDFRKDGSLFWSELSVSPVRERSGRATHFIGVQRDITPRVRLENDLEEHRKQLEQANRALARVATHDPFIDVVHRRHFLETLAREWKRAAREGVPVSLLMIDVGGLRELNDLYGHETGDEGLKRVAQALEGVLKRPADLLGRYDGEEIAALLPATDRAGALGLAEEMRAAVAGVAVESAGGDAGRLSVTIGVATEFPAPEIAMEELIGRSESALREAKEAGRDRVVLWAGPDGDEAGG
jgi:diguanylate cyclase (GGDEF)-like protein/PAS domain S-box-containing protein